jgi:glycine/D-amino acid oxidase-like deaminating enzyme
MSAKLPAHTNVLIVGGGIAGCSIAYHLTKSGVRDVVLLERRQLTCGTTWHAAGLVGQLRATRTLTELAQYTSELYGSLEAETGGLCTVWEGHVGPGAVGAGPHFHRGRDEFFRIPGRRVAQVVMAVATVVDLVAAKRIRAALQPGELRNQSLIVEHALTGKYSRDHTYRIVPCAARDLHGGVGNYLENRISNRIGYGSVKICRV